LRTYGEREKLYLQARQTGISFIRYDVENKPRIGQRGHRLEIDIQDPVLGRPIRLQPDLVTLATAIVPADNSALAQCFKVPVGEDGYFIEAHAKLRPVDFAIDGVFLCGLAHYPKALDESIEQSLAAAARAAGYLAAGTVRVSGTVAEINPMSCSRCGMCVALCSFGAPYFSEQGPAAVNPALCKGCGLCTASCRSGAIRLKGFDDSQLMAMIDQI
jgi:heterodisulfide reductase subunit A-like polyferredoxin